MPAGYDYGIDFVDLVYESTLSIHERIYAAFIENVQARDSGMQIDPERPMNDHDARRQFEESLRNNGPDPILEAIMDAYISSSYDRPIGTLDQ